MIPAALPGRHFFCGRPLSATLAEGSRYNGPVNIFSPQKGHRPMLQTLERNAVTFDARVLTPAHLEALRELCGQNGLPALPGDRLLPALQNGQVLGDYAGGDRLQAAAALLPLYADEPLPAQGKGGPGDHRSVFIDRQARRRAPEGPPPCLLIEAGFSPASSRPWHTGPILPGSRGGRWRPWPGPAGAGTGRTGIPPHIRWPHTGSWSGGRRPHCPRR